MSTHDRFSIARSHAARFAIGVVGITELLFIMEVIYKYIVHTQRRIFYQPCGCRNHDILYTKKHKYVNIFFSHNKKMNFDQLISYNFVSRLAGVHLWPLRSLCALNIFSDQGICFPPGKPMHNEVEKNAVLQMSQ